MILRCVCHCLLCLLHYCMIDLLVSCFANLVKIKCPMYLHNVSYLLTWVYSYNSHIMAIIKLFECYHNKENYRSYTYWEVMMNFHYIVTLLFLSFYFSLLSASLSIFLSFCALISLTILLHVSYSIRHPIFHPFLPIIFLHFRIRPRIRMWHLGFSFVLYFYAI